MQCLWLWCRQNLVDDVEKREKATVPVFWLEEGNPAAPVLVLK